MRRAFCAMVTKGLGALAAAIAIVPCLALLAAPLRRAIVRGTGQPLQAAVDHDVKRPVPPNDARAIWKERCSGCHALAGTGGDKGPDFRDYDSRAWIRSFLENPEGPLHMGTAKIDKGMKAVRGSPEELEALTEMVYAQTGAPDADAVRAARGRELVPQEDCDACHELDGEGENAGPNLGRRGTLAWVEAVISDAGQGRLFGEKNKMPKFSGKLTPAEIEDMARFVIAQKTGH
ncbi:MAG TPA: c-type cytochrome [Polyangia bacterium]|nr:c-type cytochrome [Polyangia bacterium]